MTSVVYNPSSRISGTAHVTSMTEYRRMHEQSVKNPAEFWGKIADEFHWDKKPKKEEFLNYNFDYRKGWWGDFWDIVVLSIKLLEYTF